MPGQRLVLSARRASPDSGRSGQSVDQRIFLDEILRQFADVGRPFAQGRNLQVDHVEAEQEVLAEFSLAHRVGEVAVRGRDDADVDRHRFAAADAVDHAFLDRAQQFGLQPNVHLGDFVEQQRAAIGFLEFADAARERAGKGAFLVAEQFGFEQVFRYRRAIDGDERLLRAGAAAVHEARQHFLAGAAFAGDEHGGVRARDLLGELDDLRHGVVAVDHLARVVGDGGEHGRDQIGIGRQRDVFFGAGMDGIDRGAARHW